MGRTWLWIPCFLTRKDEDSCGIILIFFWGRVIIKRTVLREIMAQKKGLKFFSRSIFNVPRWIGWESLRNNASNIGQMYRSLFKSSSEPGVHETFEEAVVRMQLTAKDLQEAENAYLMKSRFYLVMLALALSYHVYLIYQHYWASALVMLSFDFMLASFYFRESFWLTQIRQRRLGLTFKEWLCINFLGKS